MAYSDFTYHEVVARFGLTIDSSRNLFAHVSPVPPSAFVRDALRAFGSIALAINTEKCRSELLIAPLLAEAWRQANYQISFYSGTDFTVDPDAGLSGVADYLFTRGPQAPDVSAPVLVVVEGKKESINAGYGQCFAELVAAQQLNRQQGTAVETVYGGITIGDNWRFFRLSGHVLSIDQTEYLIGDPDKILGILLFMVGHHPQQAALAA